MPPHHLELSQGQGAGFAQDIERNLELAHIVQQGSQAQLGQGRPRKPQITSQRQA